MSTTPAQHGRVRTAFPCGRCGAPHTATTEGAHRDAHTVWDRLSPTERDGLVSILRDVLSAPHLAVQLLVLADRQHLPGSDAQ